MPFGFHPLWLGLLLVIVLIVFGPGKLPELGGAVGKAMREFRKATTDLKDEVSRGTSEPSQPPSATPVAPVASPPATATADHTSTSEAPKTPSEAPKS